MNEKTLTFRLPEGEFRLLTRYAAETGRTKTDVVREFIRSLEPMAREAKRKPKAPKR
jgi:predicted DNA-binding protein